MVGRVHLTKHISLDELRRRYRNEKNPRVKERLLAILYLYEGKAVKEVSKLIKRSVRLIERWVREWNERGYDGLISHFTGGPKPKLLESEWDKVVEEIENRGMTLKDVAVYVKDTRGVHYSYKGVWEVLRRKSHIPYDKPYKVNRKRPENAEEILKKGFKESPLRVKESSKDDPIIGFLDETSISSDPNRRRVLCTPVVTYSEGEGKRSRTIFRFMALNGNDVVMVSETAKAPSMASFLELVRRENHAAPLVVVLDNERIHTAKLVGARAKELGIIRTFLPPYSPDLNPTELPWKDLKRELSGRLEFDVAVQEARSIALNLFSDRRLSYTSYWKEKIIDDKG